MKRQLLFSGIIASLLLSSCVKSLEDEGITINNVTHFSYGGYNYQVHHDLGQMSWHAAKDACDNLVVYGYDDWFMPSMGEMLAARDAGLTWVLGSWGQEHLYGTPLHLCAGSRPALRLFDSSTLCLAAGHHSVTRPQ